MSWGKSIVLVFIAFAIFIGVLVTVCVRQNINLVSKDYYLQELNYQQEIDQLTNAARLTEKPLVRTRGDELEVIFGSFNRIDSGELNLTRPSDARYDAKFEITAGSDSIRRYDLSGYPKGKYYATLKWKMNGTSFQSRSQINL